MAASERQQQIGSSSQAGGEQGEAEGRAELCSEFSQSLAPQEGSCRKAIHTWMSWFNPAGS